MNTQAQPAPRRSLRWLPPLKRLHEQVMKVSEVLVRYRFGRPWEADQRA